MPPQGERTPPGCCEGATLDVFDTYHVDPAVQIGVFGVRGSGELLGKSGKFLGNLRPIVREVLGKSPGNFGEVWRSFWEVQMQIWVCLIHIISTHSGPIDQEVRSLNFVSAFRGLRLFLDKILSVAKEWHQIL